VARSAFFISPVAGVIDGKNPVLIEKLRRYVVSLEKEGCEVHWPLRDTEQVDPTGGYTICRTNFRAIIDKDEIHIWYDESSGGSKFDMGGVFMLCEMIRAEKKIVIANEDEVKDVTGKSLLKVFRHLISKTD